MARMEAENRRAERAELTRILIACVACYCIANISWWIQPELIHEILERHRTGEAGAGLVASVEMAAMAIISILLARIIKRASFFMVAIAGTLVAIIGTLLSLAAPDYETLLLARLLTGLGEGAPLMVSSAALARFADPDRAYGKMNVVNILFGTGAIFLLPVLARGFGPAVAFPALLVSLCLLFPLLFLMPRTVTIDSSLSDHQDGHQSGFVSARLAMLAAAVFVVCVTTGAMWSFYMVLGGRTGLSPDAINAAVATSVVTSVLGSGLATLFGARFGRLLPVTVGLLTVTVAILTLSYSTDPLVFRVAACVNVASVYFLLPYFFGYAASEDPSGRGPAVVGGAFLFTGAAGPYFGGLVIETFGVQAIGWVVLVANIFAYGLILVVDRGLRRAVNAPRIGDATPHHA